MRANARGGAFNATVEVGPEMTPDEVRALRAEQHATALEEAERAVAAIEEKVAGIDLDQVEDRESAAQKLEGMRESLAAARDELARLRGNDGEN